jgi:hypothetical protein
MEKPSYSFDRIKPFFPLKFLLEKREPKRIEKYQNSKYHGEEMELIGENDRLHKIRKNSPKNNLRYHPLLLILYYIHVRMSIIIIKKGT